MMLAVIGICFSISRATLLTLPFVITAAVYMRALTGRQIAVVLGGSAAFLVATMAVNLITFGDADAALAPLKPPIYETDASTAERVQSRSEEHTSELQSLMRISYAVFC